MTATWVPFLIAIVDPNMQIQTIKYRATSSVQEIGNLKINLFATPKSTSTTITVINTAKMIRLNLST